MSIWTVLACRGLGYMANGQIGNTVKTKLSDLYF